MHPTCLTVASGQFANIHMLYGQPNNVYRLRCSNESKYVIDPNKPRYSLFRGIRVEVDLATTLDNVESVIERASPHIRVKDPVLAAQLLNKLIALFLSSRGSGSLLLEASTNPLDCDVLNLLGELLSLGHQGVTGFLIGHFGVLVLSDLDVFVLPVLIAFQLLHDLVRVNELLEILAVFGEMDLGRNDRIKPALDDTPDAYILLEMFGWQRQDAHLRRAMVPCGSALFRETRGSWPRNT